MKRRGFLKGLAAVVALAPVVAEQVAEAAPVPPPEVLESGYAMNEWIKGHPGYRTELVEVRQVRPPVDVDAWIVEHGPALKEEMTRRVRERLERQYPLYVLDADGVRLFDG